MLNGKFYTGLTAKQLARPQSGAPVDRLKSSFFWPDETDAQPSTQYRATGRAARQSATIAADKRLAAERANAAADAAAAATARPKQLFQQQLTSKIEFCDDQRMTPKPRRRIIGGIATAQDIRDIAASIEKPATAAATRDRSTNRRKAMQTSIGPAKQAQQPKAVPARKTITFAEPKKPSQQRPGILKNNELVHSQRADYEVEPIPVYKKNIVPRANGAANRLQLSKSMDNFARLDISGSGGGGGGGAERTKRNNVEHEREQIEHQRRNGAAPEAAAAEEDYPEREYYEKWGDTTAATESYTIANETDRSHHHRHQVRSHNVRSEERLATKKYVERHADEVDEHTAARPAQVRHGRYEEARQHHSRAVDDVIGYAKHYADVKQAPQPGQHVRSVAVAEAETVPSPAVSAGRRYYPNEAAVRAQSHLRSNIFFNDGPSAAAHGGGGGGGGDDRPRSVRDAAVCRVGVGLPNI